MNCAIILRNRSSPSSSTLTELWLCYESGPSPKERRFTNRRWNSEGGLESAPPWLARNSLPIASFALFCGPHPHRLEEIYRVVCPGRNCEARHRQDRRPGGTSSGNGRHHHSLAGVAK